MNAILYRLEEGTLIRGKWSGTTKDGRETVCLYAALVPGATSEANCPADIMPQWLADMTWWLSDNVTYGEGGAEWRRRMRRFGENAGRWSRLDAAAWNRVMWQTIDAALAIAETHNTAGVVADVRGLVRRQLNGDPPTEDEWSDAAEAAWEAAAKSAAAESAAWSTEADAAFAAMAAADAAARAAAVDAIFEACMSAIEAEVNAT